MPLYSIPGLIGPTPHGVGGLKFKVAKYHDYFTASHPSRGGWIEIAATKSRSVYLVVPPLTGWVD